MAKKGSRPEGERDIQRQGRKKKEATSNIIKFAGPFFVFFAMIGCILLVAGWPHFVLMTGLMLAYEVPPAGKESIIPAGILIWNVNWIEVSLALAFMDIVNALFLVWNFDYARMIPFLGPWIERFEESNSDVLKRKRWVRTTAYIGLVLFVVFPFQGSGGIGGSVLGRIMGFKPWVAFSAICIGAISGTLTVGYITISLGSAIFNSLETAEAKIMGFLVFAIIITSAAIVLRRLREKRKERAKAIEKGVDEEE